MTSWIVPTLALIFLTRPLSIKITLWRDYSFSLFFSPPFDFLCNSMYTSLLQMALLGINGNTTCQCEKVNKFL